MEQVVNGKSTAQRKRPFGVWALLPICVSWATMFFFWPLALLILVVGSILAFGASRKAGLWALSLSPFGMPVLFFVIGIAGYLSGTGRLMTSGLPSSEFYNLDPEIRCYRCTWGCVVHGWEPLAQAPNNLAIRTMTRIFGPMPGTYHGPYPSGREALEALAKPEGHFEIDITRPLAAALGIPASSLEKLGEELGRWYRRGETIPYVSYENQTTILGSERCIFLIDHATGTLYARYAFRGPGWEVQSGPADRAIGEYTHAIDVNPYDPENYLSRGEAYLRMRDFDRASGDFRKSLEVAAPDWWRRPEAELGLRKATSR